MSKLSVSQYHKGGKITIDGSELSLRVRRLSMDEFIVYEREYFDFANGERPRGVSVTVDTSGMQPEQAFFALQEAEAKHEMMKTPAEREEDRQRIIQRAADLLAWLDRRIKENVRFPEGEVDIEGQPVVTGEDILKVFGARQVLMMQIASIIWAQNRLPEGILKNLPSPSDFQVGSGERETEAAGPTPEQIAESADSLDSAKIADATQEQSSEQS